MRSALLFAFTAALLAVSPYTAHADPITYDLALTPDYGSLYGTGTLTLDAAPVSEGVSTYTRTSGLEGLSFTMDQQTFDLAGAWGSPLVEFLNGSLYDITFDEAIGNYWNRFDLQTSGGYAFYYNNDWSESSGTISADLVSNTSDVRDTSSESAATMSPVPEIASVVLLGTGMLVMAGFARSRIV